MNKRRHYHRVCKHVSIKRPGMLPCCTHMPRLKGTQMDAPHASPTTVSALIQLRATVAKGEGYPG